MKCKKCGTDNPNGAKFCCNCGTKLEEMKCCTNPECEKYNQYTIPSESSFCPVCGKKIENLSDAPFHVRHPEYNLLPIYEYCSKYVPIYFTFKKPEYIEAVLPKIGTTYLLCVRNEKLGIIKYVYHKKWYGDDREYWKIIPCEYDYIERSENKDYFICYTGDKKVYIDNSGEKIK